MASWLTPNIQKDSFLLLGSSCLPKKVIAWNEQVLDEQMSVKYMSI